MENVEDLSEKRVLCMIKDKRYTKLLTQMIYHFPKDCICVFCKIACDNILEVLSSKYGRVIVEQLISSGSEKERLDLLKTISLHTEEILNKEESRFLILFILSNEWKCVSNETAAIKDCIVKEIKKNIVIYSVNPMTSIVIEMILSEYFNVPKDIKRDLIRSLIESGEMKDLIKTKTGRKVILKCLEVGGLEEIKEINESIPNLEEYKKKDEMERIREKKDLLSKKEKMDDG